MAGPRAIPVAVFEQADRFLWRGVELGDALRPVLAPERFRAWTLAPKSVSDAALTQVVSANLEWSGSPDTWDESLAYVVRRMSEHDATWVVPDSMARTTDRAFRPAFGGEYFSVGTTPYYVARDPEVTAVQSAWDNSGSAAGSLAILTTARIPSGAADVDDLLPLVEAAIDVAVGAYDSARRLAFFTRQ